MASSAFYQAFVEIVPEAKNLRKKLAEEFDAAGPEAGRRAGKGINSGILGGIKKIAAPLALAFAGLGIGKLFSSAIASASDLGEASTAVEAIFGPAYESIATFAKGADKALGQSNLEALNAAKSFGIFGSAAGLSSEANSEFAIGLTTLATDLASFNNTTPEAAIEAIGAALRGESEPLRQYGILLDDAALKAKALELGIYDGSGALTQQQKILAAEASIYAQAGVAVGDFAKTSEGLANQQRILSAQFENSKAKLGEALLPAMTTLVGFANTTLIPALNTLITAVGPQLSAAMTQAGPSFSELLAALIPLIPPLTSLAVSLLPVIIDLLTVIGPVIAGVAGFLTVFFGVVTALSNYLNGDTSFQTLYDNISSVGGPLGAIGKGILNLGLIIGNFVRDAVRNVTKFAGDVRTNIGNVITTITGLPGKIMGAIGSFGTMLFGSGKSLIQGFIDGINNMIGSVGDAVGGVIDFAAGFFPNSPAERGPLSGTGWRKLLSSGEAIGAQFGAGIDSSRAGVASSMAALTSAVMVPNVAARIDASVSGAGVGGSVAGGAAPVNQYFTAQDPVLAQRAARREYGRALASI